MGCKISAKIARIQRRSRLVRESGSLRPHRVGTAMVDIMGTEPLKGPLDSDLVLKVLPPKPTDTIADIGRGYEITYAGSAPCWTPKVAF